MGTPLNIYPIRPGGSTHGSEQGEIVEDPSRKAGEEFKKVFGDGKGQTLDGRVIEVVSTEEAKKIRNANSSNIFKEFYLQHIISAKDKIKYALIPTVLASAAAFFIARGMYHKDRNLMPATRINSERYESICRSILPEEMRDLNSQEAYDRCSTVTSNLGAFQKELGNWVTSNEEGFKKCGVILSCDNPTGGAISADNSCVLKKLTPDGKEYEIGLATAVNDLVKCAGEKGDIIFKRPKQEQPINIYLNIPKSAQPKPTPIQAEEDLEDLEEVREEEPKTTEAAESEETLTEEELKAKKFFESQ